MRKDPHVRRGVDGQVVEALGRRIVQGGIRSGELIDPEDVEREMGVSRTVVREVVKVLAAKGLPRRGTYVLPRECWNLLDADVLRWRHTSGTQLETQLLADLNEVRSLVEPFSARLAAQRRSEADLAELEAAMRALEQAANPDHQVAADLRFHRTILAATHNELLARLEVVLEPAMRIRDALAFSVGNREYVDLRVAVLEALRVEDPDRADQAMARLLREAAADTAVLIRERGTR